MLERLGTDLGGAGRRAIALEIEDPGCAEDPPSAQRRRRFYEGWGALPLTGLDGYHIPDRAEPEQSVPMLLLWRPGTAGAAQPTGDRLRTVIRQLYAFEYAEFAPADHLHRVLAGVTD